jgi:hypothetical protein
VPGHDLGTVEGRRDLARKIVGDWRDGGVLTPGVSLSRLEPGEHVLTEEDIRRLLEEGES